MARIWREICDTETRRTDRSETTHCRSRLALGLALACAFLSTRSYSPSRPLALAMSLARSHTQPLDIHTNGRLRGSVSKRTETEREREREKSRRLRSGTPSGVRRRRQGRCWRRSHCRCWHTHSGASPRTRRSLVGAIVRLWFGWLLHGRRAQATDSRTLRKVRRRSGSSQLGAQTGRSVRARRVVGTNLRSGRPLPLAARLARPSVGLTSGRAAISAASGVSGRRLRKLRRTEPRQTDRP